MKNKTSFGSLLLALVVCLPLLMGAAGEQSKIMVEPIVTPTQARIIVFAARNDYQVVRFTEAVSFFASQFGCRNDEMAHLFEAYNVAEGFFSTGVCVQNDSGTIRPAPFRPIIYRYPYSDEE
jgi:hypothetical protein